MPIRSTLTTARFVAFALALTFGLVALAPPTHAADVLHPWVVPAPRLVKEAYFSNLKDGASVESPFVAKFGLTGIGLAPIVKPVGKTGHHHLLVNRELPMDFSKPLPFNDQYIHFGKGQMETVINLKPGTYNLNLLLADQGHIPYFVFSRPLKLTITAQDPQVTPASVQGPKRIEILGLADQQAVKGPFRVQFHASGYNIAHQEAKVVDSGHFRLTLERGGKKEVLEFRQGQTEVWLNPPRGDYALRLELLDNITQQAVATAAPLRLNVASNATP